MLGRFVLLIAVALNGVYGDNQDDTISVNVFSDGRSIIEEEVECESLFCKYKLSMSVLWGFCNPEDNRFIESRKQEIHVNLHKDVELFSKPSVTTAALPARPLTVDRIEYTNSNAAEWYVRYVAESLPVLISGVDTEGMLKEKGSDVIKRNQAIVLESESRVFPWLEFHEERLSLVQSRGKGHTFGPSTSILGSQVLSVVVKGKVEYIVCHAHSAKELFYPEFSQTAGYQYSADPWRVNYAKFPRLRDVNAECIRLEVSQGEALYVPWSHVVSSKAKAASIVVDTMFVDELTENLFHDAMEANSLLLGVNEKYKIQHGYPIRHIYSKLPQNRFEDWQTAMQVYALVKESIQEAPAFKLKQGFRNQLVFEVLGCNNDGDGAAISQVVLQVEWRAANQVPYTFNRESSICGKPHLVGSRIFRVPMQAGRVVENVVIGELKQNTPYGVRMRQLGAMRQAPGPWTVWTTVNTLDTAAPGPPINTRAVPCDKQNYCAQVSWEAPENDGGQPIQHYIIRHYEAEQPFSSRSTFTATGSSILIDNLRPGRHHVFRVLAYNQQGLGRPSNQTGPALKFTSPKNHVVIQGDLKNKPVVTISDKLQHVLVNETNTTVTAWAAHYSPKQFDVQATAIMAQPRDACTRLENDVANQVVILERGACPLVTKVQNAYDAMAAGVIITDDDNNKCEREFDHKCSPGASKANNEGFAKLDKPHLWANLHVPTLLIRRQDFLSSLS